MHAAEILEMARLERDHWWYRGLRDLIGQTLSLPRFRLPAGCRVLDAGCGTGENLALLRTTLAPAYLGGFDLSPLAVSLGKAKAPGGDLYVSDLRDPQIHADQLDLILSCDALSIAGIEDCMQGLNRLVQRLRPGGLFILNLPAFSWLTGGHDRAIGTRDRVTTAQVASLLKRLGLTVELLTYRIFFLFPAIVAARLPSILRPGPGQLEARSDLRPVPARLNKMLLAICHAENRAICRGTALPFGSSVYALGRK